MSEKIISVKDLFRLNIIGVKVENQERFYHQTLGGMKTKTINRTKYLNICWMCGKPYESYKYDTYACSHRCAQNILYARKQGFNPPAKMDQLTKEKNIREVKERFGYL